MIDKSLTKIIDQDRFAEYVGINLTEVTHGYASANLELKPHHFNGAGNVQGGVIFTLADFTFAAACNAHDILTSAINVSISFMRAPKGNQIRAVASEVSSTNRLCVYNVDIFDADGTIVSKFVGTGYRKR